MSNILELVENDTSPPITVNYPGVDMSGYQGLKLNIKYRPNPLTIVGAVESGDHTTIDFVPTGRVSGVLAIAAAVGDTSLQMTVASPQTAANLPSAGEVLVDSEHLKYSAKSGTAPVTLTLVSAVQTAHATGVAIQKLPDLRAGTYDSEVELTDATGGRQTFTGLVLAIEAKDA